MSDDTSVHRVTKDNHSSIAASEIKVNNADPWVNRCLGYSAWTPPPTDQDWHSHFKGRYGSDAPDFWNKWDQ